MNGLVAAIWSNVTRTLTSGGGGGSGITAQEVWEYAWRTLTSMQPVTVVGPVLDGGDVSIRRGDDYYDADNRALVWSSTAWPTLTGGSVTLEVNGQSIAGTLDNADKSATFELSATQTTAIPAGVHSFTVVAQLSNGHTVTLVQASLTSA